MRRRHVQAVGEGAPVRHEMSSVLLFDPRGIVDEDSTPIAPRKTKLEGLRLGILDNSKWNANKLLRGASAALGEDIKFAAVNYYVKQSFSKDAAPELIEQIARENDIVLTAIGDCGSCCSCCIRDSVALEKLGIPSAAIITAEFVGETKFMGFSGSSINGRQPLRPVAQCRFPLPNLPNFLRAHELGLGANASDIVAKRYARNLTNIGNTSRAQETVIDRSGL